MKQHSERAHSKFSASSFYRISQCPGSVNACEGLPDKQNKWSLEGTRAHEVLEAIVRGNLGMKAENVSSAPREMIAHAKHASDFILKLRANADEIMIEERVYLDFIHPEAFGSLDYGVVSHFDTLQILDYKYGVSLVSPVENLQFIFYALATAHKFDWNFNRVRMWTLQPRVKGFDGYQFWDISLPQLKSYIPKFKKIIDRAENESDVFVEGDHCHWCRAKDETCPLKKANKLDQAITIFSTKKGKENGEEKESGPKSEADWKKASSKKGR